MGLRGEGRAVFRVRGGGFAGLISKEIGFAGSVSKSIGFAGLVSKVHLGVSAESGKVMRLSREVSRKTK